MKLNHDCIRDLLLYLEDTLTLGNCLKISYAAEDSFLPSHSIDDIRYTALKLTEAGYIDTKSINFIDSRIPEIRILSITYQGHQFLDNIRDDGVWKETKKIASQVSSASIKILSDIAAQVISNIISKQMGLPN